MTVCQSGSEFEIGLTTTKDLDGEKVIGGIYGMEAVIDCYYCNPKLFTREHLRKYFKSLVKRIDMQAEELFFWDNNVADELMAVQFIITSNITVHCLHKLERVYVNIFSCKEFNAHDAMQYTQNFFEARKISEKTVLRI